MKSIGILFLFVLAILSVSCTSVDSGCVGVVSHFGAIQAEPLPEGFSWTQPWPWASVTDISTQNNTTEATATAASKDLQKVHTQITVQWSLNPVTVPKFIQKFGNCDGCWVAIIKPAIQESVKAVSAKYAAEELITHRHEAKTETVQGVTEFIEQTLKSKGVSGAILISNIGITDFAFSPEFDASIEAKVKAEQDSLRAENEKKTRITQAEAKAKELTLNAEAEAARTKLAADATAYQTDAESKARAAAITREAAALQANPGLVQLRIAERWNGALPTYTGSSIPLLQMR